jgi:hypothetical protein
LQQEYNYYVLLVGRTIEQSSKLEFNINSTTTRIQLLCPFKYNKDATKKMKGPLNNHQCCSYNILLTITRNTPRVVKKNRRGDIISRS